MKKNTPSSHFRKLAITLCSLALLGLPAQGANYVWNNTSTVNQVVNFDGTWNALDANWTNPTGAKIIWADTANGAWFGGDNVAGHTQNSGNFTVTVDGSFTTRNLRQISNGLGNYTLNGGSITINNAEGIRVDQGNFTINSNLTTGSGLILYLTAAVGTTLTLGGNNAVVTGVSGIASGNVELQGGGGIIKLTSATALGSASGSLLVKSHATEARADTLDLNGLSVSQGRLLINNVTGTVAARVINSNTTTEATFANGVQVRAATLLHFGGDGAGLNLTGIISGDGILYTTGTGTVTITRANSYTGGTVVNSGRLNVTGNTSSGAVSVGAGGTLGGTGTIAGLTTIDGTLAAGLSTGKLTFTNVGTALTLRSTANTVMEINGLTAGSQHDQVALTGVGNTIDFGGNLNFVMTSFIGEGTYDLFSFNTEVASEVGLGSFAQVAFGSGVYSGAFTDASGLGIWSAVAQNGQEFTFTEATGDLVVVGVPEPGTMTAAGLGLVVILMRRRRRA